MSGISHGLEATPSRVSGALAEGSQAAVPWAIVTDLGLARRHNKDRCSVDALNGVIAFADGMGGDNAGEVAASIRDGRLPVARALELGCTDDPTVLLAGGERDAPRSH